ncbi:MAG: ribonuclease P protein component [Planctomycetota bacterium]
MPNARRPAADAALAVRGFGHPRAVRLRSQSDFRAVYRRGTRAHGKLLVVIGRPRSAGHRLGIAVSKEHGCAVRRNKIKRILREAFRLERPELPGAFDLIVIPRPSKSKLVLTEVRTELRDMVNKLLRGQGGKPSGRRPRR